MGEARTYITEYRDGPGRFLADGRVEVGNIVERFIGPIALNWKNALVAGNDAGAEDRAVIASLTETCKLNHVDPRAWLAGALTAIVQGHKQARISFSHGVNCQRSIHHIACVLLGRGRFLLASRVARQ